MASSRILPPRSSPAEPLPRLTALASGGGCGCKLPAADLLPIVKSLQPGSDEHLLVGSATSDDAAVFRLRDDLALVQTVDFFPPPVDDPHDYGRIAAANALSDVYAMGGTPITALNLVAFPLEELGTEILRQILAGGAEICATAGVSVLGGHSIADDEPKYGLAVTGVVDPKAIITNSGARTGDVLVLTKPLGVGAVIAAQGQGIAGDGLLTAAIDTMVRLNDEGARAAIAAGAHAMTDVTGFGLLGHLNHVCRESGLAAEITAPDVPALDGVLELLADERAVSGGSRRNAEWSESFTRFDPDVPAWYRRLLTEATTSGGLLVAVPADAAGRLPGSVVGRMIDGEAGTIRVCGA